MQLFQWIRWGSLFQPSSQSQSLESGRPARPSKMRGRPKHNGKIEPVVTALENRELIGSFIADVALAAGGVAAAERASDPFADPSLVDLSVSGGSSSGTSPTVIDRGGWQGAVPPRAEGSGLLSPGAPGFRGQGSGAFQDDADLRYALDNSPAVNSQPLRLDESTAQLSALNHSTLNDILPDVAPRTHGSIRKLQLAPLASAVGASATFVADTGTAASHSGSDIEIPSVGQPASFAAPAPTVPPFVPPGQPPSSGDQIAPPESAGVAAPAPGDSGARSAEAKSPEPVSPESAPTNSGEPAGVSPRIDPVVPDEPSSESESTGAAASSASPAGSGPVVGPPGQNCSGGGPLGLGESGGAPPITPPGQCSSSVADPLYVLNWHDGLVMFPNVIEFDQPADYVELRAQVYGATVQSYSWDTSQASRLGCATGTSTYKLQFRWTGLAPVETTEQITVTATMTDQTTQQQTLTFKLAPGNSSSCPGGSGGGSFPTTTWPAVLTPDKVLQGSGNGSQGSDQIVSDSATRVTLPEIFA